MGSLVLDAEHLLPGHTAGLLKNGTETYPRMLEAIAAAKSFVLLETYTFADDATGRQFAHALMERAKAGAAVRVMYDAIGSKETPREFFGELRAAGCLVNEYNPLSRFFAGVYGRRRNHRKLLVVDGVRAFAGGLNIAKEYATIWRDTCVEIHGPVVSELARLFVEIWRREERKSPRVPPFPAPPASGPIACQALSSDVWKNRWRLSQSYRYALEHARRRIWLSNAYFVPGKKFQRSLHRAAARGVDVRVLVPAHTDILPVYHATRALFSRLLGWGVRIFEWEGPMMHAKTAVLDGEWSVVGSYNLDHLSLFKNLELAVVYVDRAFGASMEAMYEEDLKNCREVQREVWKRRPWTQKFAERFFYLFRSFL